MCQCRCWALWEIQRYINLWLPRGRLWFCWERRHDHVKWVLRTKAVLDADSQNVVPTVIVQAPNACAWRVYWNMSHRRWSRPTHSLARTHFIVFHYLCFSFPQELPPASVPSCVCVWCHCLFASFSFPIKIVITVLEWKQFKDNASLLTSMNRITSANRWYRIRSKIKET